MVQVPTAGHIPFGVMTLTYFLSIMGRTPQVPTFKECPSEKGRIPASRRIASSDWRNWYSVFVRSHKASSTFLLRPRIGAPNRFF